ncbi:hypothetical protein [Micromonospora coerulea]|uniref:hypothetical protein n=1 Tax=Micromonospora coerulea TaxID=47856 RepID=UPI001906F453|nr:hypothetical protein [Micromonospora veneta]
MTGEAGTVLKAAAALRRGQQTYSGEQVAYLMHLAYDSGRTATHLDDIAATHANFAGQNWRLTYEQWVAAQLDEMDRAARARAEREGRPYRPHPGGAVDWETGQPIQRLEIAA